MIRFYGHPFLEGHFLVTQLMIGVRDPSIHAFSPEATERMIQVLQRLEDQLVSLEMMASVKSAGALIDLVKKPGKPRDLQYQVDQLFGRLRDEFEEKHLLFLAPADLLYVEPREPLFGSLVEDRFPAMSEDISEAGKCLGFGRYTATVFHLMRSMELALQHLGGALGIQLSATKSWQNILDEVNKAVRLLNHKEPRTVALTEAASHLYNVKVAWRNEVMHPKQSYTEEQAVAIFGNVRTFIRDLAGLV